MTDPFRISSGDSKIPELSVNKDPDRVLKQIQLMDPHTVFLAIQTVVIPVLSNLHSHFSIQSSHLGQLPSPSSLLPNSSAEQNISQLIQKSAIEPKNVLEVTKGLDYIKKTFQEIQNRLEETKKNYKELFDKIGTLEHGKVDENGKVSYHNREGTSLKFPNRKELLASWIGRMIQVREFLEGKIGSMEKKISDLSKFLPDSLLKNLRQTVDRLKAKIPKPSDSWKILYAHKDSKFWVRTLTETSSEQWHVYFPAHWSSLLSESYVKDILTKPPMGLWEMTQDPGKLSDYFSTIKKGMDRIDQFYQSREILFLKLGALDTEEAYMYLITVLLPFLQNESAGALEQQGNTMKQVSKAFDKWNEIQDEINGFATIIKEIKKKGLIDESGTLKITNIIDHISEYDGKNYKVVWIKDDDQSFKPLIDAKKSIDTKINEMKTLLKDLEEKLPPSQKSLITTMKELTDQLVLKRDKEYSFYYHPSGKSHLRFEIRDDLVNLPNNKDFDYMRKFIFTTMRNEYLFMVDADQTKFKAYMDNIAQGITALTSMSNMTQQELQIATQYYNSLLGLQKIAFDSLNKVIQLATKNPNH